MIKKRLFWIMTFIVTVMLVLTLGGCDIGNKSDDDENGNNNGGGGGGINPNITIRNNTGYDIDGWNGGLWIKPSTVASSWGSGLIFGYSDQLDAGASRTFTLSQSLSVNNVYDFRMDGGGFSFRKYGVTVSNGMTITFSTSDLNDGSSQPSIVLQNRSGKAFNSVRIKPTTISDWGGSFGSISNNSDLSITILIPPSNYTVFDIQMESTNPTNTYTKNNVTLSNGMTLIFTSADADNSTIELPVIVIQNSTGYDIDGWNGGLWIKSSTSESWGSGLIFGYSDQLDAGKSRAFSLSQPLSSQNLYDIRLSGGGFNFIKSNVTVTEGMILTFTTSDLSQ